MADWAEKAKKACEDFYPTIVEFLDSPGFEPPKKTKIVFKKMNGVAYTVGALVQANHGDRADLRVDGVPVGREIGPDVVPLPWPAAPETSSILIVIDAINESLTARGENVVELVASIAVMAAMAGVPIWLSMIIGLLVGVLCGLLNGLMITRLKLPPFIATLGMMMVARGVALTITNANAWPAPDGFGVLGNDAIFRTGPKFPGISYPVLIMIAVAFIFHFILAKTRIGRYTYAIGSNEEAARLSGIRQIQSLAAALRPTDWIRNPDRPSPTREAP